MEVQRELQGLTYDAISSHIYSTTTLQWIVRIGDYVWAYSDTKSRQSVPSVFIKFAVVRSSTGKMREG